MTKIVLPKRKKSSQKRRNDENEDRDANDDRDESIEGNSQGETKS